MTAPTTTAVHLRRTCNACPVQYEGNVGGVALYFRARYDHWAIGIGGTTTLDAVAVAYGDREGFSRTESYDPGGDGFSAGSMDYGEAEKIIRDCVAEYLREKGEG